MTRGDQRVADKGHVLFHSIAMNATSCPLTNVASAFDLQKTKVSIVRDLCIRSFHLGHPKAVHTCLRTKWS